MSTLRDEVAAAFDTVVEETPDPVSIEATATDPVDLVDPPADPDTVVDPPADPVDAGDGVTPPTLTPDTQAAADAPPASWSAAEKASWAKLPAELKAPILRREKEIREAVRVDGTSRKFMDSIHQTIQPYAGMLDKTGLNPVAVMQESLRFAQAMNAGTAQEKAETIGKVLQHFNVDIEALDAYLVDPKNAVKASSAPAAHTPSYDPMSDKRLSPLFSLAQQVQAKTEEAAAKVVTEAQSWPGFEEARNEMADLMEFSEARGQPLSMGQAYTRVTGKLPPQPAAATTTTPADQKRPTPKAISDAAAVLARSRKAASSVSGSQRVAPPVDTDDIRATVSAAANGLL